ncbi:hypothetical protein [uncultured Sphaerochaeta sp.]|uniref:hypothetical protein n=1 Tax=uncultured Sphaerochaeta sp. TaxID=886478 RepID=UPI0029CA12E4|nr:hypothetical protein [uncultured Sphaerochaeta sp.]
MNSGGVALYSEQRDEVSHFAFQTLGSISECLMESYVMFYVVEGEVVINKEGKTILNMISRLALHAHPIPYCNHL